MCSIIGSVNFSVLTDLINKNQFRGTFSFSLTLFDFVNKIICSQTRQFGEFDLKDEETDDIIGDMFEECRKVDGLYYIAHVQAPTGGLVEDVRRIHPSTLDSDCKPRIVYGISHLYHNGILKEDTIKFLQQELNSDSTWDTELLHQAIRKYGFSILSKLDGSFGCLMIWDGVIYIFTNELVTLYMNNNFDLSSVKINDQYERIQPNIVYMLNLDEDDDEFDNLGLDGDGFNNDDIVKKSMIENNVETVEAKLIQVTQFETFNNPYYY